MTEPIITENLREQAKILWNYNNLGPSVLQESSAIIVLGCTDTRVARHAASVLKKGYAPIAVCTGRGNHSPRPEADIFAETMEAQGVNPEMILREKEANNTGENVQFSLALLEKYGLDVRRVILVSLPYMERRAFATFSRQTPDVHVNVTSPDIDYDQFHHDYIPETKLIHKLVGVTQRIMLYPLLGHQIYQPMDQYVLNAYNILYAAGFTKYTSSEQPA